MSDFPAWLVLALAIIGALTIVAISDRIAQVRVARHKAIPPEDKEDPDARNPGA